MDWESNSKQAKLDNFWCVCVYDGSCSVEQIKLVKIKWVLFANSVSLDFSDLLWGVYAVKMKQIKCQKKQ